MFTFDFHNKLKQLNKDLFVDVNFATLNNNGEQALAVKRKRNKRISPLSQAKLAEATSEDRRYLDSSVNGSFDEFIMAVPYPYVPEYDEFEPITGRIKKKGWRTAALQLVRSGIISLDEARRVFHCRSLGENLYDKLNSTGKYRLIMKAK